MKNNLINFNPCYTISYSCNTISCERRRKVVRGKFIKRVALIMILSAFCIASIGCSHTEKLKEEQSSKEDSTEEIVINTPDVSAELTEPQMTTATTAETLTEATSTQEVSSRSDEANVEPSTQDLDNSSNKQGVDIIATNEDLVQIGGKKQINGYQTVDGAGLPVTVTFEFVDVRHGENAYTILQSSNAEVPQPDDDMEYIVITLNVTYNEGEPDILDMSENNASMVSERRLFALSNGDSNAEQMTSNLSNSIYNLTLEKGESGQGAVAFLRKASSAEPLTFIGFGNVIKFNISN